MGDRYPHHNGYLPTKIYRRLTQKHIGFGNCLRVTREEKAVRTPRVARQLDIRSGEMQNQEKPKKAIDNHTGRDNGKDGEGKAQTIAATKGRGR